jgi:threonine dehydrogenase-like Zn-dependent dehydrogenase
MLAIRSTSPGIELAEVPPPQARREALIRVLYSGICATDIEITRGYAGFAGTLGHEFVGVVEGGDVRPELIGKRVVAEINVGCQACALCLAGDPRHCPDRTVLGIKGRDGAHAEYLSLPERSLHVLPATIDDDSAVFVEPLAAALGITERTDLAESDRIAVIGDGRLGLLCSFVLGQRSKKVTIFGKHASKLSLAQRRGIRAVSIDNEALPSKEFDVVVEASGSASGLAAAVEMVAPRGRIVLKSTYSGATNWEPWRVVVDEISIIGSRCGRLEPAIEVLAAGNMDVKDLIHATFPLSEGLRAFEEAERKGVLKVLLASES